MLHNCDDDVFQPCIMWIRHHGGDKIILVGIFSTISGNVARSRIPWERDARGGGIRVGKESSERCRLLYSLCALEKWPQCSLTWTEESDVSHLVRCQITVPDNLVYHFPVCSCQGSGFSLQVSKRVLNEHGNSWLAEWSPSNHTIGNKWPQVREACVHRCASIGIEYSCFAYGRLHWECRQLTIFLSHWTQAGTTNNRSRTVKTSSEMPSGAQFSVLFIPCWSYWVPQMWILQGDHLQVRVLMKYLWMQMPW